MKAEVILALDVDSFPEAKRLVEKLYPTVKTFKVGAQLFTACGPRIVEFIRKKGAGVFLDLKFFDIPNTVANSVRSCVRLGVRMLTLHISGGQEMLKEAIRAGKEESRRIKAMPPLLIGVTVLTSQKTSKGRVLGLARDGIAAGLDGIVCSVQEAAYLRKKIKKKFVIVTPGIRLEQDAADDQKRVATARQAQEAGSNFLVVGRPILKANDPKEAARQIIADSLPKKGRA